MLRSYQQLLLQYLHRKSIFLLIQLESPYQSNLAL